MAKTSTTTVGVTVSGDGVTASITPTGSPVTNTAAPHGGPIAFSLASGFITVPTATTIGVVVIPPVASVISKTLKGLTGDTGFLIRENAPSVLMFPTGTATIKITAGSAEDVQLLWL